jgi:hypothetical protein
MMIRHYRYLSNAAISAVSMNSYNLMYACGVSASSTTAGYPIANCVRLRRIQVWAPPASQGAGVTVSVLFPSTNQSPSKEFSDTSVSVMKPAYVSCSVPPSSTAGFWQNSTSNNDMWYLTCPSGTIVDIDVEIVLVDGQNNMASCVLVGAATGGVYYTCLDNSTNASGKLKPISLSVV